MMSKLLYILILSLLLFSCLVITQSRRVDSKNSGAEAVLKGEVTEEDEERIEVERRKKARLEREKKPRSNGMHKTLLIFSPLMHFCFYARVCSIEIKFLLDI